jgi:hypothetical protein
MSLQSKIAVFLIGFAAFSANATVYKVSENSTEFSTTIFSTTTSTTYSLTNLFKDETGLLTGSSLTTTFPNLPSNPVDFTSLCGTSGCSFIINLINTDTIIGSFNFLGQFSFPSADPLHPYLGLTGNTTITGGTGFFEGAKGSGSFVTFDDQINPSTLISNFSIETTAPIPEPENYAMLIVGLGVMGFVARRRKL